MNSSSLAKARSQRDPLAAILSPDKRLRQDVQKAVRYVSQRLEGEGLRAFTSELSVLLAKWNSATSEPEATNKETRP